MFKIILVCGGVPNRLGVQAAKDLTQEFAHRPWHRNAVCRWNGLSLELEAENETDLHGKGLMDEFSDAISICIKEGFNGNIFVKKHIQGLIVLGSLQSKTCQAPKPSKPASILQIRVAYQLPSNGYTE